MEQPNLERIWTLMARKLSGEAALAELDELEQLLHRHPEANYSMEVMQDLWKSKTPSNPSHTENEYRKLALKLQQMGIDDGRFNEDDHYIAEEEEPFKPAHKKRFPWLTASVLVLCGLFFAGIYILNNRRADSPAEKEAVAKNEISTRYGSKTALVLPDGSKVWLNAGSTLTYSRDYATTLREVSLSGEAFFDVVKNAARPFIIHTGKMDIKVLGTAFNVKCYPEEKRTETSLIRGSIEITLKNRPEKIVLKPNEKITIADEETVAVPAPGNKKPAAPAQPIITLGYLTREPVNNEVIETSWVDNRLIFNNETFEDIAVKMERWYAVKISFGNEKLKQKRFTGIFEKETVGQALTAMQLATNFNYHMNKDHIIISL
jgi:transmembrane sensor